MTDDLLDRVRAADPAATLAPAAPSRARVTAARRRRAGRRATGGVLATAAAAVALAAGSLSGGGTSMLAQAAQAATLPPSSIVVTTTAVRVRSNAGGMEQQRTTWVRVGGGGEVLASRIVNVRDGEVMSDDASRGSGADAIQARLDPRTGDVRTERGAWQVPSLLFEAQALLRAAQRDADVQETTYGGRPAYRVTVTGHEEAPLAGDRDELLLDAETYAPLELRKHSEGRDVHGKPFTYDYSERVIEQRTLRDTAANRAQLEVGAR